MAVRDLRATIMMVTNNPASRSGSGWQPTGNLAERCLQARVKWGRQVGSLRFAPATFQCVLDVTDGMLPETQEVLSDILRSEIYCAVSADGLVPRVLFHGWVTEARWVATDGQFLTLSLSAQDAMGQLVNAQSDLSVATGTWHATRWLREAALRIVSTGVVPNRVRALSDGLEWARPDSNNGPGLSPRSGYFERGTHPYQEVLQEIRHQTQGRIGVAHGWAASYTRTAKPLLGIWGEIPTPGGVPVVADRPLPSFLAGEFSPSLFGENTAFLTPTGPTSDPDRRLLFSEKTGWLDPGQNNAYRGYQWTISNFEDFEDAVEPEGKDWPELINTYQRGQVTVTNRGRPPGTEPDYFAEYAPPDDSPLSGGMEELTSMGNIAHVYNWSNWIVFNDQEPRLHYKGLRVPVHFAGTSATANAILSTNLHTKVRVRVGGRSSELLDRTFRVDGAVWDFQSFSRQGCGVTVSLDLLEVRQTTPWIVDHAYDPALHRWNQSQLNNGNILT